MITLHNNGVFLAGGVPAAAGPVSPEEGRKRTMAWSILQAHNISGDPEHLQIRFDAMVSHDITYVGIIQHGPGLRHEGVSHPLCADQLPQQPVCRGRHHQRGRPRLRPLRREEVRRYLRACQPVRHPLLCPESRWRRAAP